jgi:large subunit ribosomal protein L30e
MAPVDEKMLEKTLQNILKTGKYTFGLKESTKSLKSVKLMIYANTLDAKTVSNLESSCAAVSVPTLAFPGSSLTLGRLCNRPFKVSALSVKSAGEADLTPLLEK